MKKKLERKLALLFVTILFLIATGLVGTYYHELAHQQIYAFYGVNSVIGVHWWGMDTTPSGLCTGDCTLAQSIVEAIGYNLVPVIFAIFLFVVMMIVNSYEDEE